MITPIKGVQHKETIEENLKIEDVFNTGSDYQEINNKLSEILNITPINNNTSYTEENYYNSVEVHENGYYEQNDVFYYQPLFIERKIIQ